MIKILNADQVESSWFNGRVFSDANKIVKEVIDDVIENGDAALKKYAQKFDSSSPATFLVSETDLKSAAEKLKTENPDTYDAICYSHELALKFAKRQRESFDNFEMEISPGMFTGQKNIPVEKAGVYVPAGRFPLVSTVVMTVTPAIAAGVNEIVICTPPKIHPDDIAESKNQKIRGNAETPKRIQKFRRKSLFKRKV